MTDSLGWQKFVRSVTKTAQLHSVSADGFWLFCDASRPTNRMTQRNKHHLYRVWVSTADNQGLHEFGEYAMIERDINLVSRTHWPAERTPQGHFAKGHRQNVRLLKDGGTVVQCYGAHLWLLENTTPDDSGFMLWDDKPVDVDTIIGLLNFERHPDNPTALFEAEMMHKPRVKIPTLFD